MSIKRVVSKVFPSKSENELLVMAKNELGSIKFHPEQKKTIEQIVGIETHQKCLSRLDAIEKMEVGTRKKMLKSLITEIGFINKDFYLNNCEQLRG